MLILVLLLNFLTQLSYANSLPSICLGEFLQPTDSMCQCRETREWVNPWNQKDIDRCEAQSRVFKLCRDEKYEHLQLKFISGRCFCPYSRKLMPGNWTDLDLLNYTYRNSKKEVIAADIKKMSFEIQECELFYQQVQTAHPDFSSRLEEFYKTVQLNLGEAESKSLKYNKNQNFLTFLMDQDPGARTIKTFGSPLPGTYGGHVYKVVRRAGATAWYDGADFPARQGDPRYGIFALGEKLGSYFGYKIIDSNTVQVPDEKEISGALHGLLSKSNREIQRKFYLGFYPADEGSVSARKYLELFVEHGFLPIGNFEADGDQNIFFHDISHHIAGLILMPDEILELSKRQGKAIFDFEEYLKESALDLYQTPEVKHAIEGAIQSKVQNIDAGTGNLTMHLSRHIANPAHWSGVETETIFGDMVEMLDDRRMNSTTASPAVYLESVIRENFHNANKIIKIKLKLALNNFKNSKKGDQKFFSNQDIPSLTARDYNSRHHPEKLGKYLNIQELIQQRIKILEDLVEQQNSRKINDV